MYVEKEISALIPYTSTGYAIGPVIIIYKLIWFKVKG